ncbi:hypothetical protein QBC37DRAFT_124025 [Rhypophila decipiens]|uniref:Yeast cell wall synthesis Kre9/Knh1-like N-terminal domain-containing protein n=1 Tax=Rhypophila decipiens TaxID=261697 RepID=A0AAN6YCU9_9PEZI|nr:hypothetical protein QBC37DRAFT_124025 [Rhypophila decipiens]
MRSSVIAAAFLAACAQAIKVTSPTKDQVVDLSAGFKVTFDTVSTDPTSAHLFLVNMAGGGTPFSKDLGEVDLTKPFVVTEEDVPAQKGYQFNVQSVETHNSGILAQSQQFEVKPAEKKPVKSTTVTTDSTTASAATGVTVVSSATGTASADVSGSSTLATVTGSGSAASSKPTATSTSSVSEAAAPTGKAVAGGSVLALAVAGLVAVMA